MSQNLASSLAKLSMTPFVIGMRAPIMMAHCLAPTEKSRAEIRRMTDEKIRAAVMGAVATQMAAANMAFNTALQMFVGRRPAYDPYGGAKTLMGAAYAPAARAVAANQKRLAGQYMPR